MEITDNPSQVPANVGWVALELDLGCHWISRSRQARPSLFCDKKSVDLDSVVLLNAVFSRLVLERLCHVDLEVFATGHALNMKTGLLEEGILATGRFAAGMHWSACSVNWLWPWD